MKKQITTVIVVALLIGLASTTGHWLAPFLAFVGANTDLIQGLTDLVQLVLWLGAGVVGIVSLWSKPRNQQNLPQINSGEPTISIQPGSEAIVQSQLSPAVGESGVAIGRDFSGTLYLGHPTTNDKEIKVSQSGSNISWAERDQEAVEFFVENYSDFNSVSMIERDLVTLFENWQLLDSSRGLHFTHLGSLLFGSPDRLPIGTSTDVLLTHKDGSIGNFFGLPLMKLFKVLYQELQELWSDTREDPSRRDGAGRPVKISSYPQTAIIEALVNFVIHREYQNDEVGYINIYDDRVEMKNPGASPYNVEELLSYSQPLQPKYRRNANLLKIFSRTRFNQRQGGGLLRIRQAMIDNENIFDDGKPAISITNDKESDRFIIIIYKRDPGIDLVEAENTYLRYLANRYRYLDIKGIPTNRNIHVPLIVVFVPPSAYRTLPVGETWNRSIYLGFPASFARDLELLKGPKGIPTPLAKLLQDNGGLVVLGDPGTGKTTLLRYIALSISLRQGELNELEGRIPFLVPISEYANTLARQDMPLNQFIAEYYENLGIDLPVEQLLERALNDGRALFLLDGLDEVINPSQRHFIANRLVDFYTFHHQRGNKFIITSRIVGYRSAPLSAPGLVECTIADFDDAQVERFVECWALAIHQALQDDSNDVRQKAMSRKAEILAAIHTNPGVRQFASNPLLLTILILLYFRGGRLPQRRVQLYETSTRTLLETWNFARSLGHAPYQDTNQSVTLGALSRLAFWMQENSPTRLVTEQELFQVLEQFFSTVEASRENLQEKVQRFLIDVRERAGILLERGRGLFGFIHIAYQEYLAARAIASQTREEMLNTIVSHVGEVRWHEVILLTAAQLAVVEQRRNDVDFLLRNLLQSPSENVGEVEILVAKAIVDIWPSGVQQQLLSETKEALRKISGQSSPNSEDIKDQALDLLRQLEQFSAS